MMLIESFNFSFCYFFNCFWALAFLTILRLENLFPLFAGQDILMQATTLANK